MNSLEQMTTPAQVGNAIFVIAGLVIILAGLLSILISWRKLTGSKPTMEEQIVTLSEQMHEGDAKNERRLEKLNAEVDEKFADLQRERIRNLEKINRELQRIDRCMVAIAVATNAKLPKEIEP